MGGGGAREGMREERRGGWMRGEEVRREEKKGEGERRDEERKGRKRRTLLPTTCAAGLTSSRTFLKNTGFSSPERANNHLKSAIPLYKIYMPCIYLINILGLIEAMSVVQLRDSPTCFSSVGMFVSEECVISACWMKNKELYP